MFGIEKLFNKKTPQETIATKSFFDDDLGTYAIWGDKYGSKSVISSVTPAELINLYTGWIYACINVRSDAIASLDTYLYPSKNKTDTVLENPILDLIGWELRKNISSMLDLWGSCYLLREMVGSKTIGLKILRSDALRVKQLEDGTIYGYSFYSGSREFQFDPSQIIVIHKFNPKQTYPNITSGVSPTMAIAKQQIMDMMAVEYNYLFFKEGGKPGTILKTDKKIDEDAKKRIIDKWNNFFAGLRNSHKTAILDQGLEYQSTTIGQKDLEFVGQREFTREEILMMFGVPKPLLGKSDGVGFADRQVPEYYFQKYHVLPLARQIQEALNKTLFAGVGYFSFGKVVSADLNAIRELYTGGALSVNELREVHGFKPVKQGYVNNAGVEMEVDSPKAKSIFSETDLVTLAKGFESLKKKSKEDEYEIVWKEFVKRADTYERDLAMQVYGIFEEQEKIVVRNFQSKKSVKEFLAKAEEDESTIFDSFISGAMWIASGITGIFKKVVKKEGDDAFKRTGVSGEFNASKLDKWIITDVAKFGKEIDKVTKKTILELVKEGYDAGKSEPDIIKDIRSKFTEFKTDRVQKIVRTEITKAVGRANMEAYEQAGIEKKQWYTNRDERTCPHCGAMHLKIIGTSENFFDKGATMNTGLKLDYEAIAHPPLHTNCRCILIPII